MLNLKRMAAAGALATMASGVPMMSAHASFTILPGFDLLQTHPGTGFPHPVTNAFIPMTGAPQLITSTGCGAAQFNFGSGCVGIGNTSAILHRPDRVDGGPGQTVGNVPVVFKALGLRSAAPVDLGMGAEYLNVTLAADGGQNSMAITFDQDGSTGGTFTSNLDFTVRIQGESTQTVYAPDYPVDFTQGGSGWVRYYGPALRIPGVNYLLNGADSSNDFFTGFRLVEVSPGVFDFFMSITVHGPRHIHKTTTTIPVPAAAPLLLTGLLGLGFLARRRRAG